MRFSRIQHEPPEINLIPFIDVLLVILIFLMLSTTFSQLTQMQVELPVANSDERKNLPDSIVLSISRQGQYAVNDVVLPDADVDLIANTLKRVANGKNDTPLIIEADGNTTHQSVIRALEASKRANLWQITFATRSTNQ